MGVDVRPEDLSISHRLPGPRPKAGEEAPPRAIIAKFVRRDVKAMVMKKKKSMKDKDELKDIYVEDDLTVHRRKVLWELRRDERFKQGVSTYEGKIILYTKEDGEVKKYVIDNLRDLRRIGWTDENFEKLGIYDE